MGDKEKIMYIMENYDIDSIEGLVISYLTMYGNNFSSLRMTNLMQDLSSYLTWKVESLENLKFIAKERALYLKAYLNGSMWDTEEDAKANLQPQIDNAQAIIDACKL